MRVTVLYLINFAVHGAFSTFDTFCSWWEVCGWVHLCDQRCYDKASRVTDQCAVNLTSWSTSSASSVSVVMRVVVVVIVRCHAVLLDLSHQLKTAMLPHAHIGINGDVVVVFGRFGSLSHEMFIKQVAVGKSLL